jgi:pimeloyl-ACP methyl ester carboxylesterase
MRVLVNGARLYFDVEGAGGGPAVRALARRRFLEGHADADTLENWVRLTFPVYTRTPRDPRIGKRAIRREVVHEWFSERDGEVWRFDLFPALGSIACPTLVMGGEDDPTRLSTPWRRSATSYCMADRVCRD